MGEGLGQTFVADDTLIRSVVLWRIAGEDTNYVGMRLFVYETDSSSVYPSGVVPNPNRRVLNGKTVVVPFGDGVHPVEFKWDFDPPLALPHRGTFAFFVFQDPCGLAYLDVLTLYQRPGYPSGDAWATGRSDCSGAIHSVGEYPDSDVIFQIEFCHDGLTHARRTSWGRLKTTYR